MVRATTSLPRRGYAATPGRGRYPDKSCGSSPDRQPTAGPAGRAPRPVGAPGARKRRYRRSCRPRCKRWPRCAWTTSQEIQPVVNADGRDYAPGGKEMGRLRAPLVYPFGPDVLKTAFYVTGQLLRLRVVWLALEHLIGHRFHLVVEQVILQHRIEIELGRDVLSRRRLAHLGITGLSLTDFGLLLRRQASRLAAAAHRDTAGSAQLCDLDQIGHLGDLLRHPRRQLRRFPRLAADRFALLRGRLEAGRALPGFLAAPIEIHHAQLRAGGERKTITLAHFHECLRLGLGSALAGVGHVA